MSLTPGETINNRYRIVKILGQGGFGAVYRAWDTNFNMPCALKENLETTPEAQRQFEREARMLRTLKHANLPLVTDYFILPGRGQYLVMDFVEGQDVEQLIQANLQPLPVEQVIDWVSQICDALEYLHQQNPPIIHRDIKPANIRITPAGQAILVDFGIAKAYDPGLKTSTGARALTPGYAPVEQYGQGKTDARSDIYALGATLYTLLTGERPVESIERTLQDTLPAVDQLTPTIPPYLVGVVSKAMDMDPARRYPHASQFKRALQSPSPDQRWDDEQVPPTLVAPMPGMASPYLQPAGGARHPAKAQPPPSSAVRWGVIGGAGIVILLAALVGVSLFATILYNQFIKDDPAVSIEASATSLPGEMVSDATPSPSITEQATGLPPTEPPPTEAMGPTSTPFTAVEKPDDIPVMPGNQKLTVYEMEAGGKIMPVVSFVIDSPVDSVVEYYEQEMAVNGWTKLANYTDSNNTMVLYFQKDQKMASVILSDVSGELQVTISIQSK